MRRGRRLTIGSAVLAVAFGVSSCAAGTGDDESSSDELTFVSWGGGYQDAQESEIVQPWADEEGVTVRSDGPTDYTKLQAQVESGNVEWDVVTLEPFWAIANCGTLLEEIEGDLDTDALPEEAVSDCGIPFDILSYMVMYDADQFGDDPPTSWADFFDTEKYPGKRGVWNYAPGGALEAALLADGVPADDLYPLDVDRAFDKLDTIRDDIAYYDTGAQQVQQMQSGEVAMTIAWSGRGLDAVRSGANYEPIWDDHLMLVDSLAVPKGSDNVDKAVELIEYATSVESQERFLEAYTYGSVNDEAQPELDELGRKFSPTEEGHFEMGRFMDQQWWADNLDAVSEEWTKWASG